MKFILTTLALAALTLAADKPDLSGLWKMDASQSDFGGAPAPESFTRTIQQSGASLTLTDEQVTQAGKDKAVRAYSTDGKEITYRWMGNEVKSSAHWDGDALVIIGKVNANGTDVVVTSTLALSPDGKTLTESDKLAAAGNDAGAFKVVLLKQ